MKIEEKDGQWVVKITDKGRKEILKYKWAGFKPKSGKWDGLWRMVFLIFRRNKGKVETN